MATNPVEKRFSCENCSYSSNHKRDYSDHVKAVHKKVRDQICQDCGRGFSSKSQLKLHVQQVHNEVKAYKCEKCGSEFKVLSTLKRHDKRVHRNIRPHVCDECEKGFSKRICDPQGRNQESLETKLGKRRRKKSSK